MKSKKFYIVFLLLVIFYTVGVFGILNPGNNSDFLSYTPFNLILTTILLIWANGDYSKKIWMALVVIFAIGFGVEVAGVKTGILFGEYSYGKTLGTQVFDVPLTIGLNWFILSISAASIGLSIFKNKLIQVLFAAALMTGLDVLIEPVAIQLDFWSWAGGEIPIQNFVMWFVVAVVVQFILTLIKPKLEPKVGYVVFGIQVLFFLMLNLFLGSN